MSESAQPGKIRLPARVLLVGVGGMGVNAIDALHGSTADFMDCVAIDSDQSVLDQCHAPRQIQIGVPLTQGHSTGGDSDLGRRAAINDFVKLREVFTHSDLVILLAGLGGGLGSGAAPVIAQTARDEGALVITVATLPFNFEGKERAQEAEAAVSRLREAGQALVTLPNEYLCMPPHDQRPIEEAFRVALDQLADGLRLIWTLLGQRNLINLDFINLKNMLEHSQGACRFVYAEASGASRAPLVLSRLQAHPAIQQEEALKSCGSLLIGVLGSTDLALADVQSVVHGITAEVHANAHRVMGVGLDEHARQHMGVLLLIGDPAAAPAERAPVRETKAPVKVAPARPSAQRGPKRIEQPELELPTISKGRFKNVEPTVMDGEDLDLPTFIRRGLRLSR